MNLLAVAKDSHELNRLLLEWFRAYAFMLIHKNDANIQPFSPVVNSNYHLSSFSHVTIALRLCRRALRKSLNGALRTLGLAALACGRSHPREFSGERRFLARMQRRRRSLVTFCRCRQKVTEKTGYKNTQRVGAL